MPKMCNHISQLIDEFNNLIEKIGDTNSTLYRKLGPIVDKADISPYFKKEETFWKVKNIPAVNYKWYHFPYISPAELGESLSRIGKLVNNCNCYSEVCDKASDLCDKYNELVDEFNEKNEKNQELKKGRLENLREGLENARKMMEEEVEKVKLQEELNNVNLQNIEIRKQLVDSEKRNDQLLIKLDDKNNQQRIEFLQGIVNYFETKKIMRVLMKKRKIN